MKIAYFSPLNPTKSGIADYSEELLPYLAEKADIDLFIDDYKPNNKSITGCFSIYNYREFESRRYKYDVCVYHQGNNPYHEYIYNMVITFPGIMVLHDYLMHHLVAHMTLARDKRDEYIEIMRYSGGQPAADITVAWLKGYYGDIQQFLFPCNERLIENSLGVIVHNDYAKKAILQKYPNAKVKKINHHLGPLPKGVLNCSIEEIREHLKIPKDEFIIASFGFITPPKRVDKSLEAFKAFKKYYPGSVYFLVGEENRSYDIRAVVRSLDLKLNEDVIITGYVDLVAFHDYLNSVDLCVNLRYPTAGETSGVLIRSLGAGKPVIVSNYRQFAEFPDEICLKSDFGPGEVEQLLNHMLLVASNRDKASEIGRKAKEYITEKFSLKGSAEGYYEFIKEIIGHE